jgi:hypothetical protein
MRPRVRSLLDIRIERLSNQVLRQARVPSVHPYPHCVRGAIDFDINKMDIVS